MFRNVILRNCEKKERSLGTLLSDNPTTSILKGSAFYLQGVPSKQSTGLFLITLAKRFEAICGALPHTPQKPLPLDSAEGTQSLWNPIHWYKDFFDRLRAFAWNSPFVYDHFINSNINISPDCKYQRSGREYGRNRFLHRCC